MLILRAIRPHQLIKNLLVFSPIILAHQINNTNAWSKAGIAFLSICFLASAIYLLNDIFDKSQDQLHPLKKNRPIASGEMEIPLALINFAILLIAGLVLAYLVNWDYLILSLGYIILNIAYSTKLKKIIIVDAFTLSVFFTIRIWMGGLATGILLTSWLMIFSFFLFLSLSFLKRYVDGKMLKEMGQENDSIGRSYSFEDLNLLFIQGNISSYLSVLVFFLYVFQERTHNLYPSTKSLWFVPMMLLLWQSRLWYRAHKGKVEGDPVKFVSRDPESIFFGFIVLILMIVSSKLSFGN